MPDDDDLLLDDPEPNAVDPAAIARRLTRIKNIVVRATRRMDKLITQSPPQPPITPEITAAAVGLATQCDALKDKAAVFNPAGGGGGTPGGP